MRRRPSHRHKFATFTTRTISVTPDAAVKSTIKWDFIQMYLNPFFSSTLSRWEHDHHSRLQIVQQRRLQEWGALSDVRRSWLQYACSHRWTHSVGAQFVQHVYRVGVAYRNARDDRHVWSIIKIAWRTNTKACNRRKGSVGRNPLSTDNVVVAMKNTSLDVFLLI